MRTIKFRAFNLKTEKYVDLESITPLALDSKLNDLGVKGIFIPFDEWMIVEQFTGLHDKNGREIYEGDIVGRRHVPFHGDPVDERGVVKWMEPWACFRVDTEEFQKYIVDLNAVLAVNDPYCVIGNRWENPELLKSTPPLLAGEGVNKEPLPTHK